MENFMIYNPTRVHFGRGVLSGIASAAASQGKTALLVSGKNSARTGGHYGLVADQLKAAGCEIIEYSGIKSNPVISDVDAAAELGRQHKVGMVAAVGGGSVIDSAKIIALAVKLECPAWDIMVQKVKPTEALPIIAVLTLAATGTEMNPFAVVQNDSTLQKPGFFSPLIFPKHSFLDPSLTLSVPPNYTSYGIVDLVAHCLENFFGKGETSLTDRFIFGIIREAVEFGPALMVDLQNYRLREKIMFAALCALNGMTAWGKASGDWGVHSIGHSLSVLYDVPHGASLSVAYPAWLEHHLPVLSQQIALLGKEVFGTSDPRHTLVKLRQFFKEVGSPVTMAELGLGPEKKDEIVENLIYNKAGGYFYQLTKNDLEGILGLMFASES